MYFYFIYNDSIYALNIMYSIILTNCSDSLGYSAKAIRSVTCKEDIRK